MRKKIYTKNSILFVFLFLLIFNPLCTNTAQAAGKYVVFGINLKNEDETSPPSRIKLQAYSCENNSPSNINQECERFSNKLRFIPRSDLVTVDKVTVWQKYVFFVVSGTRGNVKYINARPSFIKIDNKNQTTNIIVDVSVEKEILLKKDSSYEPPVDVIPPGPDEKPKSSASIETKNEQTYEIVAGTLNDDKTRPKYVKGSVDVYPSNVAKITFSWQKPEKSDEFESYSVIKLEATEEEINSGEINRYNWGEYEGVKLINDYDIESFSDYFKAEKYYQFAVKATYKNGYTYSNIIIYDLIDPDNPKLDIKGANSPIPDEYEEYDDLCKSSGTGITSMISEAFCGLVVTLKRWADSLFKKAVQWLRISIGSVDSDGIEPSSDGSEETTGEDGQNGNGDSEEGGGDNEAPSAEET